MTEAEWLACTDPKLMLEFLRDKASDRKLRLFGCACCRRLWTSLVDDRSRLAVVIAEQFADGFVGKGELQKAHDSALAVAKGPFRVGDSIWSGGKYSFAARMVRITTARRLPLAELVNSTLSGCGLNQDKQPGVVSHFLRDLFGNPFRPVTIDRTWLMWNAAAVVKLARNIYDDRAFDSLPILADALEEAGCHDDDILNHCRQPGPHVCGCWVVDFLLGKE
jgi:hypothetical protein